MKEGQETAVEKHNIQVSSFSGTFHIVSLFFIMIAFIPFIRFMAFTFVL